MASKKSVSRFSSQERVVLPGSEKPPFRQDTPGAPKGARPGARSGKITVSVIVRPKQPIDTRGLAKARLTRAEFRRNHGADPAAVKAVRAFAAEFGLALEADTQAETRTLRLSGSAAAMEKAFGVQLGAEEQNGESYRVREGAIYLPAELAGAVEAVLGLDNRPQAKPHFRVGKGGGGAEGGHIVAHAVNTSYTPVQVAAMYQFPANASAAGQTIGIIELGGGYRTADITAYFKSLGLKAPTVVAVSVDKGKNTPGTADSADGEVMLDIEVAAAVAPGAKIAVYFAPNTDQGFVDAISTAAHDTKNKPSVISISWGAPESSWTQQAMNALDAACQAAAALGVTITASSGDDGSTDGVSGTANHVDFPASSPHILACGGTKLVGSGSKITSEVVWNELSNKEGATGGGVSAVFAKPTWQSTANVPKPTGANGGRGVPDVAGDADPVTGYVVRVDGQSLVIGGTSAVSPLWAGLIAVANKQNGKSAGFINPVIYAAKARSGFRDITEGNNGGFSAGAGWDACTGLGSPVASKLIPLLAGSGPSKKVSKQAGSTAAPVKVSSRKSRS